MKSTFRKRSTRDPKKVPVSMNLRLLQLGDSALPIGGYSHSWGLEAAIDRGLVFDPSGLEGCVRFWLRYAVGPFEGVVVAVVCRAAAQADWPTVLHANDLLWTSLTPPTLRHASRDMGEQLLALAEAWPWASSHVQTLSRPTTDYTGFPCSALDRPAAASQNEGRGVPSSWSDER